jgi:CDGSH-type Zn-finger protein
MNQKHQFRCLIAAGTVVAATALIVPAASATPADGDHQVTICHVTNSAVKPYVVITVDVAAFDGEGANDHTRHMSKDNRVDLPYVNGQCQDPTTTTTTTTGPIQLLT